MSRLRAAETWATHPVSRMVLTLALLTGCILIGTANWAPSLLATVVPTALLLLALCCIVLASVASGVE